MHDIVFYVDVPPPTFSHKFSYRVPPFGLHSCPFLHMRVPLKSYIIGLNNHTCMLKIEARAYLAKASFIFSFLF